MSKKSSLRRFKFCNFKLEALLEITNAINANLSVDEILDIYKFLLIDNLNIGKIVVFAYNKVWEIMLQSGANNNLDYSIINVNEDLIELKEITSTRSTNNNKLVAYDFIIPVFHDKKSIAYVLIGDFEEEGKGVSPTIKHLHFVQTLTNIIFVAIENKRLYEANIKQERIKKELELATEMQNMLVPDVNSFPKNGNVSVSSFYLPHLEVGGDYFNFEKITKDEYFFCIADVSGKGVSAALLMSNFQASLKAFISTKISLPNLMNKLNERIVESAKGEKFITVFAGVYNTETKKLNYVNAGHNPPILFDKETSKLVELKDGCPGIGMLDEIPFLNEGRVEIEHSSKLICFTDGLSELENLKGVEVGLCELKKCISNKNNIESNFNCLKKALNLNKDNRSLFDDITILGIDFF